MDSPNPDFPELDEATLNAMVRDFENMRDFEDTPIPSPPNSSKKELYPELPFFEEIEQPEEKTPLNADKPVLALKEDKGGMDIHIPSKNDTKEIKGLYEDFDDVKDLALMENVFDKRVSEKDFREEFERRLNKNDSGKLLTKDDVEVKTELNDMEILTMSKLRFIAERYHIPALKVFSDDLMTLKISRHRKGRTEFIQGLHADEKRENPQPSFFSRFFGMGGGE